MLATKKDDKSDVLMTDQKIATNCSLASLTYSRSLIG